MKQITLEEASKRLGDLIIEAAGEAIILVRDGKPVGLLSAWPDLDLESLERASSPEFWKLIEARRKSETIPWNQARKEAGL